MCLLGKEGSRTVVYEYNVSLNSATELTAKDTALCQYCTVQAEDMLYIIGGNEYHCLTIAVMGSIQPLHMIHAHYSNTPYSINNTPPQAEAVKGNLQRMCHVLT